MKPKGSGRGAGPAGNRTGRLAETIREVVAEELERLGDDELDLVTVTGVEVSNDLAVGTVYFSCLTAKDGGVPLEDVLGALADLRWPIQQRLNRVLRARRTPQIRFEPDRVLDGALRLDELLRRADRETS